MSFQQRVLAAALASVCIARAAHAQQPAPDDPAANARIKVGAIALTPRISVGNIGLDTNVFNSTDDEQSDFTFTLVPGTQMWLRTGKGLLSVDAEAEVMYFNKFDTERALNSSALGRYELRFNRMQPYLSASTLNTRQRPGYEIDVRARHYETDFHGGVDLRVASKSSMRADFRHLSYTFAGDAVFNGQPLNRELNRTLRGFELGWRQRLTVLTTWVAQVDYELERFAFDAVRDSNSVRFSSGFELGRLALIRGSAFVGYRKLTPSGAGLLPEYAGVTADVDVTYTAPTQTRLGAEVDRDIQYSYLRETPYFVQTGWTGTLTQRITGRWDVQLRGGRDRLAYRAIDPRDARTDFVGRFGGGVGYALAEDIRVSVDANSFYRRSDLPGREYGGIRAGLSVTYGY